MPTSNPVPSQDPSDLLFNAEKLDEVVNGTANSFTDRLGATRRTVAGMNADFDAQLADAESDLNVYRSDAAASAAQALGYLNTIRATSYGAYASDPATDPLGNPPTVGDEYFNTTANLLKRWNGTTWQASDINTASLAAPSGSSLIGYDGGTVQDALDAVTGPTGAGSVGYTPAGSGAVATAVQSKLRETVSVKDFGAKGDGVTDDTAAIQAARDYIASLGTPPELIFPSGIYKYTTSPNWAIQDAKITAQGEVRLRYTGTGNAVMLNANAADAVCFTPGLCYNVQMGRFIIEAPSTAQNGVYIRSIHHSKFGFVVRGAGATYAGIRVEFGVCNLFDTPTVSGNQEGWYLGAKPQDGLYLTRRAVAEECSYSTFLNPILEGVNTGAVLEWALGNTFYSGTMEGCTATGIAILQNSRLNKLFNVDFEVNTSSDIYCEGSENEFYGCDSDTYSLIASPGKDNLFVGGSYQVFTVDSGANDNTISGLRYNRFGSALFTDNGTRTRLRDLVDITLNVHHNVLPTRASIVVGASPYTYTNNTGNAQSIIVTAGTIVSIAFVRNAVSDVLNVLQGMFDLSPGDSLTITYTAAPYVILITR